MKVSVHLGSANEYTFFAMTAIIVDGDLILLVAKDGADTIASNVMCLRIEKLGHSQTGISLKMPVNKLGTLQFS